MVKGSRSGKAATPGEARLTVLAAAERCIQRHGISKTTMDDIAREAGMSRPSVYRYFSDREELLLALTAAHSQALTKKAQKFIDRQETVADGIVEGLLYIADHGHRDEFTRFLVARDDSEFSRRVGSTNAFATLAAEFWDPFLNESEARGELKPGLNRSEIHIWLGSVGLLLMSLFEQNARKPHEYRDFLHTFVAPAFVPGAPTPTPGSGGPASGKAGLDRPRRYDDLT